MTKIHCRFHSGAVADKVKANAQRLTNVKLSVERHPHEDPKNANGTGVWAICSHDNLDIWDSQKVDGAIAMAFQWTLADELAKSDPRNPMLSIYHIANRTDLAGRRYDVDFSKRERRVS